MGSVNKVILVGNLGADPELKYTPSNRPVCNLSVATNEVFKDKTGQRQERTEWHRVAIFNQNLAKVAKNYLRKGSKVYLEGQIQTRKWTDQSGQERYTTEVVIPRFGGALTMLDGRGGGGGEAGAGAGGGDDEMAGAMSGGGGGGGGGGRPASRAGKAELDDDIPF